MNCATADFTEERRLQIVALLELLNAGLPEQRGQRKTATPGFVTGQRPRTCPDCLANGRVMKGCETCAGSGTVVAKRLGQIASPDAFDDDGQEADPYAVNHVQPYGVAGTTKVGHVASRDAEIDRMDAQLREPWKSPEDELDDANRNPYPWERERAQLRRRYDIDPLIAALEVLRDRDPGGSALLHAVYVYGETYELATLVEQKLVEALRFISDRMPDPIRAPGHEAKHPALERRDKNAERSAA